MFTNLESKLKGLAEIILAAGIISSILLGIIIIGHDAWAVGIIILIYGMITSFISTFLPERFPNRFFKAFRYVSAFRMTESLTAL